MLRALANLPHIQKKKQKAHRMEQHERGDDGEIEQDEAQRGLEARGVAARQRIDLPAIRVAALFSGENSAQFAELFRRQPPQHLLIRAALQADDLLHDRRQQRVALAGEVIQQPRAEYPY